MSFLKDLADTYDNNLGQVGVGDRDVIPLWPIDHITYKAHISITINGVGDFIRAAVIAPDNARTIIPATESSAGRTSGASPHPLCDKLQYVAGDFSSFTSLPSYFSLYEDGLSKWCSSPFSDVRLEAVLLYVRKKCLIQDLITAGVIPVDDKNNILNKWSGKKEEIPELIKINKSPKGIIESVVRWTVEIPKVSPSDLSLDPLMWSKWSDYNNTLQSTYDICYVTGEKKKIALQHPKKIRNDGDGTKIISSNDLSGFTFRGRFTDEGSQACVVSSEVSQKAHNALRWIIGKKQAYRNEDQVIAIWSPQDINIPNFIRGTNELLDEETNSTGDMVEETAHEFAVRIAKYFYGYGQKIGTADNVIVLGMDAASEGRLSITSYQSLNGTEYLKHARKWHEDLAWMQRLPNKKGVRFAIGAPAPGDIAVAAYGRRIDPNLKKITIMRLLPCIIEGKKIPRDIVETLFNKVCNRIGLEYWEWETTIRIFCSVFRGYSIRNTQHSRRLDMAIDITNTSRDYLFGRLLAVAERIESMAIYLNNGNRETNAVKLMQRFANYPCSTWKIINMAITPYRVWLKTRRGGFLTNMLNIMQEIHALFLPGDFASDEKLGGEFIIGYWSQREELFHKKSKESEDSEAADVE